MAGSVTSPPDDLLKRTNGQSACKATWPWEPCAPPPARSILGALQIPGTACWHGRSLPHSSAWSSISAHLLPLPRQPWNRTVSAAFSGQSLHGDDFHRPFRDCVQAGFDLGHPRRLGATVNRQLDLPTSLGQHFFWRRQLLTATTRTAGATGLLRRWSLVQPGSQRGPADQVAVEQRQVRDTLPTIGGISHQLKSQVGKPVTQQCESSTVKSWLNPERRLAESP